MLLAIESVDDGLVGYTNHSYEIGRELGQIFESMISS